MSAVKITASYLRSLYDERLTLKEMNARIRQDHGVSISVVDISKMYKSIGLNPRNKQLKPKWELEVDGQEAEIVSTDYSFNNFN
jgi:hypothetical protein